ADLNVRRVELALVFVQDVILRWERTRQQREGFGGGRHCRVKLAILHHALSDHITAHIKELHDDPADRGAAVAHYRGDDGRVRSASLVHDDICFGGNAGVRYGCGSNSDLGGSVRRGEASLSRAGLNDRSSTRGIGNGVVRCADDGRGKDYGLPNVDGGRAWRNRNSD